MEHFIRNVYLHKFQALKPVLDAEQEQDPANILTWFGAQQVLRDIRDVLVRTYSWAIPNRQAIETIAHYSPLVEVGAGSGYWAYLLQLAGADIIATDAQPGRPFSFDWPEDSKPWFDVQQCTAKDAVTLHSRRTLFLCWPTAGDEMASTALRQTEALHVVFVGWKDDDVTGDQDFHDALRRDWLLVETVDIPQWPGMRDRLFVYKRR
jgi:hypothetical protein